MYTLSLDQIIERLKTNSLPPIYKILLPNNLLFSDLFRTASQFKDADALVYFIKKICASKITFSKLSETIEVRSLSDFLYLFARSTFRNAMQPEVINSLLSKIKFSKEQLLSIFKEESIDFNAILLSTQCFEESDLLAIVNSYTDLTSLSHAAIKQLYLHFNPIREWKESLTPLLEMHYLTTKAGHALGLKKPLAFTANETSFKFDPEGEVNSLSLLYLVEYLGLYNQKLNQYQTNHSQVINTIFNTFEYTSNLAKHCRNTYKEDAPAELLKRYKNNELTYLTSWWPNHSVGLAFYGDYLIYTNRGQAGDQKFGSKIYKIKNKKLIDEALFKLLGNDLKSPSDFYKTLEKLVDIKNPVLKFRCKGQKHGTCSFVNPKAIIEPMIALINVGPFAKEAEFDGKNIKRTQYKHFTEFVREAEIDELIKDMFYAKDDVLIVFFAELAKKIIREHNGKDRGYIKDKQELKRACEFYGRIPEKIRKVIDKDESFVSLIGQIKAKYKIQGEKFKNPQEKFIFFKGYSHRVHINNKGNIVAVNKQETPQLPFSYRNARTLIGAQG